VRRIVGIVLVGLGFFGIVLAVLFPTVVVSGSKKTPLDLDMTIHATGPAKVLDSTTNQLKDVTLRATQIVRTDTHASDGTYTTVNEGLCIVIVDGTTPDCLPSTDPRLLSVTTDRVTTDRKTGKAVHIAKYLEDVNKDTSVRHDGFDYWWPIDSKKQTYAFYQPDLHASFPATYEGTSKLEGLTVYQYTSATGTHPYKVQGLFDGTYTDTRTVWVEPKTGNILKGTERQVQALANGQVALDATLTFDNQTVHSQANYSKDKIKTLDMAQLWAPLACALLGIAGLIGGAYLLRSHGRHGRPGDDDGNGAKTTPPPDWQPNFDDTPHYAGSSQT
jgi:Porin PorA